MSEWSLICSPRDKQSQKSSGYSMINIASFLITLNHPACRTMTFFFPFYFTKPKSKLTCVMTSARGNSSALLKWWWEFYHNSCPCWVDGSWDLITIPHGTLIFLLSSGCSIPSFIAGGQFQFFFLLLIDWLFDFRISLEICFASETHVS